MLSIEKINCIVLVITCLAVIWYSFETKKLRLASQLEIRLNAIDNIINSLACFLGGRMEGECKRLKFAQIKIIDEKIEKEKNHLLNEAKTEDEKRKHQDNLTAFEELKKYRLKKDKIVDDIDNLDRKKGI